MQVYKGSCECRDVTFEVTGQLRPVIACHCDQCRKSSGHFWASTYAPSENINITSGRALSWFQSTDVVRKGFCRTCGSSLFWKLDGRNGLSISGGAFDDAIPAKLEKHIFVSEKGCYYEITDGLPQADQFDLSSEEGAPCDEEE